MASSAPHAGSIVLATGNPHKVSELKALFAGVGARILALPEALPPGATPEEPAETGRTFEENAAIKALAYSRQTGLPCLADDSGLEIDALEGRPGVISSHYATDGRETGLSRQERDEANNLRVLGELEGVPFERRSARFVCVMALAMQGAGGPQIAHAVRGTFEGRIGVPARAFLRGPATCSAAHLVVPRGDNGFGYDPLFLVAAAPHDFTRTSAELAPEEKNRLSHRGAAAALVVAWLKGLK